MKIKKIIFSVIIFLLFFAPVLVIQAANTSTPTSTAFTILPACTANGNCGLCDFLIGFANISTWGFTVIGSLALLFFVYGGFTWVTAAGNEERIKKGRGILVNTVIGIIIVFASWMIINFVIVSLTGGNQKIFNGPKAWYNYCTESFYQS